MGHLLSFIFSDKYFLVSLISLTLRLILYPIKSFLGITFPMEVEVSQISSTIMDIIQIISWLVTSIGAAITVILAYLRYRKEEKYSKTLKSKLKK